MDFFNDLGKRFSSVARSVSEKTRDGVESSRLAGELKAQTGALTQAYAELGRMCYDARMGDARMEDAAPLFDQIRRLRERIEELTAQRDTLREVRRCPGCGGVMPREARFCFLCGKRLPEPSPEPAPENPVAGEYCPRCGAWRGADQSHCGVCGAPFEPGAQKPRTAAPPAESVPLNPEEPEHFEDDDDA